MNRNTCSLAQVARGLKSRLRFAALAVTAVSLAACQQYQTPEDLLFAPTFNKSRQNIPYTYNTPYDCRTFTGSGWKGIAAGRVVNFSQKYLISEAGCFRTRQECEAYLSLMRSYIDVPRYIRCSPYSA
ncbi:hypothetical protein [Roseibium salinum]|uniref:Uncharacterized protein n=1 Tax=Roseibium salinum TaxID=1604349 RepID=A0ABT3QZF1_9HYPH|nr:hypothetical protein [Roseibium sp. DSM 29163]MCX2722221.1 hypothetical protein [Roseibium sp. DSM 29163]MDN3719765.1 hypothetical protein [Roseibium salinum]